MLDRIPTVAHHALNQQVGVADRRRRMVDEVRLRAPPRLAVALCNGRIELAQIEAFVPSHAIAELGLRFAAGRGVLERPVILGPELAS